MSPVGLAAELVRIPSVNPEGAPGVVQTGEAAMAARLEEILRDLGADASMREVLPGRPNIVARFPADRPGKPRLLLAPHTDTVGVAGMTIDPFGGEIRDGRLFGRGACDTKGSMACMLAALAAKADSLPRLSHEIWFAGLMGEESGLHGSGDLAKREHFDFVIAGEPTGLHAVVAHKGSSRWTLTAHGRAAHASTPRDGINAIDLATGALAWLRGEFDMLAVPDPVLGMPTMSVGTIRGGIKVNVVPDVCRVEVDMRTTPAFPVNRLKDAFLAAHAGITLETTSASSLSTNPNHPLVALLERLGAPPTTAPWFCDAASFADHGTPAIALGPGSIAQAHTADEWIALSELENGARLFSRLLESLAEDQGPLPSP
jgi:acetylornithine deacetylase/succinyl-diaminopimelate desuccinylase-like protein